MKLKKGLVITAFSLLLLWGCSQLALAQGGFRKNRNTSIFVSLENAIISKSDDIYDLRMKWDKAPYDLNFIKDIFGKDKAEYKEEILKEEQNLMDFMASTPEDEDDVEIKLNDFTRSNKEALEIKNGVKNLINTLKKCAEKLERDKSNATLSKEYYIVQIETLSALIKMHGDFTSNVEYKYKRAFQTALERVRIIKDKTQSTMEEVESQEDKNNLSALLTRQKKAEDAIVTALEVLERQKIWAERRLSSLRDKMKVAMIAKDTSEIVEEIINLISVINTTLRQLNQNPPPMVIFDVDISKMKIDDYST
jgi:hypothetical protein